jgi:diguanylate cyclase (GGDEF)-like protein
VIGALASMLLGLLLFAVSRDIAPLLRPAVLLWLRGNLLLPAGFVLLALRGQINDLFSIPLANVLVLVAFADFTRALHRLLGQREPRTAVLVAVGSVALGGLVFTYGIDRIDLRTVISSLALAWMAGLSARLLLGQGSTRRTAARMVTGSVFLFAMLLMLLRTALTLFNPDSTRDLLGSTLLHGVTFATGALLVLMASYGFLLLCTDRMLVELERTATIDFLTGILNRGAIEQSGARACSRARRRGSACAAVVIDIDHFKRVNDAYGHAVGDQALRAVVERLREGLRSDDTLGRLGGEEFLLLIDDCDAEQAMQAAERLRHALGDTPLALEPGPQAITISLGVAVLDAGDASFGDLLRRADRALYVAKAAGRNRSALAPAPAPADAAALSATG